MRPKKDVTLKDIAEELGVSVVTVSNALAGRPGVSGELRERIRERAETRGLDISRYQKKRQKPDAPARESISIGVIVAERFLLEEQSFYWKLYQELSLCASRAHRLTLLEVITPDMEAQAEPPKLLAQGKADIVIVLGPFNGAYLDALSGIAVVPLISLDSVYERIDGDAVTIDNIRGGYQMTRLLIEHGHRRIGYVGTLGVTPSIDDRFLGYYKAMWLAGLSVEEKWRVDDRDVTSGLVGVDGTFSLPKDKDMPTAFFCNSDLAAQILIEKLEEAGYRVPEDISVAGCDAYLPDHRAMVSLATYDINMSGLAAAAVELVTSRLSAPTHTPRTVIVRGSLVEGESVAEMEESK